MLYGYLYQIAIMDGNATPEQILEEVQRREICFGSRDYIIPALKEKEKLIAEMRGHLCGNYGDEYVLQIESEVRKLLDEMRK